MAPVLTLCAVLEIVLLDARSAEIVPTPAHGTPIVTQITRQGLDRGHRWQGFNRRRLLRPRRPWLLVERVVASTHTKTIDMAADAGICSRNSRGGAKPVRPYAGFAISRLHVVVTDAGQSGVSARPLHDDRTWAIEPANCQGLWSGLRHR